VNIALVLEGLGLWPYQAAKILFGKRPAARVKVTIDDPNAEVPTFNKGLAELLSCDFLENLTKCMADICPEAIKPAAPAICRSALVEILVNAIAHADYTDNKLPNIEINIRGDSVTVKNDTSNTRAPMFAHNNLMRSIPSTTNPILTQFFVRLGLMKGLGLGRQHIYLETVMNGAAIPKTELSAVSLPIGEPTGLAPAAPQLQWSTTLYAAPSVRPEGAQIISPFIEMARRLHESNPETQDSLLLASMVILCGELCADAMRARGNAPIAKPVPCPLASIIPLVGGFYQRDIEAIDAKLGDACPFTIQQVAVPEDPSAAPQQWIQLADWAWEVITQSTCYRLMHV